MTDISREQALAHFGVKGMRWGVRNETTRASTEPKQRMSTKKKVAISAGVIAIGSAITLAILAKNGNLPIKDISTRFPSRKRSMPRPVIRPTDRGSQAAKRLSESGALDVKIKKLLADFDADIADAHKVETEWMRKNVPSYNPRTDPYIPKSELERLRG